MNRKSTTPVPEAITQLQRQLEQFRSTQPGRTKLPESLWQAAVELARQHGIYAVGAPIEVGLHAAEATAERHSEPLTEAKANQTGVRRTDRERRDNSARVRYRV